MAESPVVSVPSGLLGFIESLGLPGHLPAGYAAGVYDMENGRLLKGLKSCYEEAHPMEHWLRRDLSVMLEHLIVEAYRAFCRPVPTHKVKGKAKANDEFARKAGLVPVMANNHVQAITWLMFVGPSSSQLQTILRYTNGLVQSTVQELAGMTCKS